VSGPGALARRRGHLVVTLIVQPSGSADRLSLRCTTATASRIGAPSHGAGVRNLAKLATKPTRDLMADLDRLTIPPSEALLGTLVLRAVRELHEATRARHRSRLDAPVDADARGDSRALWRW
jgi:hypothetical protein